MLPWRRQVDVVRVPVSWDLRPCPNMFLDEGRVGEELLREESPRGTESRRKSVVFGIRHLSGANECTDISSTLWCHTPPMCQEYATPVRLAGVVLERERDAGKMPALIP